MDCKNCASPIRLEITLKMLLRFKKMGEAFTLPALPSKVPETANDRHLFWL